MAAESDPGKRKPFEQGPTVPATATGEGSGAHREIGRRIGPYKLLGLLGEGGFGVVYQAEQTEPVRRRVALKIIKPGMDTKAVIARFEAERQALALMDHPNVARVFDAGTTEQGRPYFVMEHVPGVPITEHCDRQKLNIEQRLDLFMQVCDAVQHAHQKGIIHRDIKPTNILVAIKDVAADPNVAAAPRGGRTAPADRGKPGSATGVPKVIDFGVAKAVSQPLTERTIFTAQGQLIGTPEYISPEQAEMTAQDIDTRSDIYSLGVLLYELLTGALPFDRESLRRAGLAEIQRIIREVEPPKPSTRLSSLAVEEPPASAGAVAVAQKASPIGTAARAEARGSSRGSAGSSVQEIARSRSSDARTLTRLLRGDLDWITMKALEKDRTRRYATASDLAVDIARHLNHEPVVAGPPSAAYRVRKFVRRNQAFVTAAAVVLAVLVLGVVGTTWGLFRAIDARQAEAEQRQAAESARAAAELAQAAEARLRKLAEDNEAGAAREAEHARREAAKALRIQEFLENMLASVDPHKAKGADITVREVLDEAAATARSELADEPEVLASVLETIAKTYVGLLLNKPAIEQLRSAVEIRQSLVAEAEAAGQAAEDQRAALQRSEKLLSLLTRLESLRSPQELEEARSIVEDALGPDHPLATIFGLQAKVGKRFGKPDRTLWHFVAAAINLLDEERFVSPWTEIVREVKRKWAGGEAEGAATFLEAEYERLAGKAEQLARQGKDGAVRELVRGAYEPVLEMPMLRSWVPFSMTAGAALLLRDGKLQAAEIVAREAQEIARQMYGESSFALKYVLAVSGMIAPAKGDPAETTSYASGAEQYWRDFLEESQRAMGDDSGTTLATMMNLASLLMDGGKLDEAEKYYRKALEGFRRTMGDDDALTLRAMRNLAWLLKRQGKLDEAEQYYREALEGRRRVLGEEHADTLRSIASLAYVLGLQGKLDEAEKYYREALDGYRRTLGDHHADTLWTIYELARALSDQSRLDEAEAYYREALRGYRHLRGADDAFTTKLTACLADFLHRRGKLDEAETVLLEAYGAVETTHGAEHEAAVRLAKALADLYEAWGKPEQAAEWRAKLDEQGTKREEPASQPVLQPTSRPGSQPSTARDGTPASSQP